MKYADRTPRLVIAAKSGIQASIGSGDVPGSGRTAEERLPASNQRATHPLVWIPAFAGMTVVMGLCALLMTTSPAFASEGVGGDVDPLIYRLAVFALAIFVGYYVVWSVTPALHTPLMSVTNAISSVIVVGALLAVGVPFIASGSIMAKFFGVLAVALTSVNIFGGFLVTQRMLAMYKKKEK